MPPPPDWYRTFFQGAAIDTWRAFATPELTRSEADFLLRVMRLSPSAHVLDVPCGNARLGLELALRGYRVTGVDLSPELVGQAQSEAQRQRLPVTVHLGDMRDLRHLGVAEGGFDGAFCWGNSFGYLEDEGNVAFVHAVSRALKPGARFVLETGTLAETILPNFQERRWFPIGDTMLVVHNHYDHVRGRLDTDYHFVYRDKWETRQGTQRVYTYRELCGVLAGAGLGKCEAFSSLNCEPLRLGTQRSMVVATKLA